MVLLACNNLSQMISVRNYILILLICTLMAIMVPSTKGGEPYIGWKCVDKTGNYTLNSPYQSNLIAALSNLTTLSSSNSFANFTAGDATDAGKNKVYALYDCRDDLPLQTCHDCVVNASATITQICPLNKEAVITYEECFLRYASHPIVATLELKYALSYCNLAVPDDRGAMNRTVTTIVEKLIDEATSGSASRYFAVGRGSYFVHQDVYCLVQCTPDLSRSDCKECLMDAYNSTIADCASKSMLVGLHSGPSCRIRYSWFRFFNLTSGVGLGPSPSPSFPVGSPRFSPLPINATPRSRKSNGSHGGSLTISNAKLIPLLFSLFLFCV
ncbi:hypothetical protein Cgig2_027907 [Carnegiea gigantea]|uniref:Gnk2-homologous domain-containing protein n=1 Tax=Carnegiea gigantea TaxID=171969 RepID=A0A9Q1KJZ5_9CARY|nr:hypothetical protein Cgig2_027907 [Carnegiea gigantea]